MKKLIIIPALFLILFNCNSQVLDPVKWKYSVEKTGEKSYSLILNAKIDNKWHLYAMNLPEGGPIPLSFTFAQAPDYELIGKTSEITKPEETYDESFQMKIKMFSHEARFVQKIKVKSSASFQIKGTIEYQVCDDERCIPKDNEFTFDIPATEASGNATIPVETKTGAPKKDSGTNTQSEQTDTASTKIVPEKIKIATETAPPVSSESKDSSLWVFFFISLGAGFVSIFTPCVYPMIPMTVSFFMQGENKKSAGILKGLIFGLSIIFIYTMIGLIVMLTKSGADLTAVISTHWIPNILFFLLFVVFAASFFGMFEIVLPGTLANKVDQKAEKGGMIGSFFMALTLVIVSFSCTGPVIGYILVEASQGIAFKPVIGMFGYSIAFAIPFVLFAFTPALMKKMAKSGTWLNSVKVVFAFFLLAFSLKFLATADSTYHWGILSRELYLSIWIVIFGLLGLYLIGKLRFSHDSELNHVGVPRLIMAIAAFSFSVYLIPGLFGAPLNEISSLLPAQTKASVFSSTQTTSSENSNSLCNTPKYSNFLHLPYGLQGYFDYNEGLACAKQKNKPILLDIKGHACANCKKMESNVWSDPRVLEKLNNDFIIIALYTDDRFELPENEWITSTYDGKVKKTMGAQNLDFEITRFNINTQPLYVILNSNGETLNNPVGLTDVETYLKFLENGKNNYK